MTEKKSLDWASFELLSSDLRQACRQLYKAPVFTATVVMVLAVGLGVSVAIFSIVRNVLLSPLPYNQSDRLAQIVSQWPRTGDQNDWSALLRDAMDWKTSIPAFQDVAMYRYNLVNLTGSNEPESLYGLRVTANLLPMLGITPQLGSWFSSEYERPGNAHVIVLSADLWRRRFHSDPEIVGKTIHLDSDGYEVVGVMPAGFNFPLRLGTTAQLPTDQMQYWMLQREYPTTNRDLSARLSSLHQQTTRQVNAPLLALLAATALILLLACVNTASLLLARGESRASELAVRMALGGSASRVARLPMLQGILLCCLGSLLGLPVAMASMSFLLHLAPVDVPRLANARIDVEAVLFATALAILCGIFVGGLNSETGAEWNTTSANLLLSSSDVRSLNQMQLRVLDQEEATFRSGERYPIMTSSYTALTSSSSSTSSTATTPQVQYEDLGLTLKVKPHIEGGNRVSLDLNLKVESLAGSTINDIPVLANRQYTSVVCLRLGESALVVSAMSNEDSLAITGIPGLSEIPGLHNATDRQSTTDSLDLVILVTPHIARLPHREAAGSMLLLPLH